MADLLENDPSYHALEESFAYIDSSDSHYLSHWLRMKSLRIKDVLVARD